VALLLRDECALAQGEKVARTPLWQNRSRRSRPSARSGHQEARGQRPSRTDLGTDVASLGPPQQRSTASVAQRPTSTRRPRKPRRVAARLPSSCCSPCDLGIGARRCRAGRPRSNQRRLPAARRRRTTGRRGAGSTFLSSCQGARPALARPAPPGAGVRARFSRVRDRARQGRNGKAGSSAADEPGPKGDVQILAVRAPILMWNLPERTCLYAVRSPRTRSCAPVSPPYFPAVRVARWGCQPDSGRRRPSSPGTATRPNPIRRTNRS